jgi:hypothetical protein
MRALMAVALLIFSALACASDPNDTPETRLAAAERYFATIDLPKLMEQVLAKDVADVPGDDREQARALVREHFRYGELMKVALQALAKNFTTKELNAMADFYGSAEGRSVIAKYPAYLADVMPSLVAEVERALVEIQPELQNKRRSQSAP